jgi:hypothetical protein
MPPKGKTPKAVNRTVFKPARTGQVTTSANIPVGASAMSVNNALQVIPYEPGNMGLYNNYFGSILPEQLELYFYLDQETRPDTHDPMLPAYTIENSNKIMNFTPTSKFTDGLKHNVLGIRFNGKNLKIKWTGMNEYAEPINGTNKLPFFYVEDLPLVDEVDANGNPIKKMTKYWGVITTVAQREAATAAGPSGTEFGKRKKHSISLLNREIKYLMKLK